ncbi:MAG: helicase SNF2, partial [Flavihumibacter sp.]
MALPHLIKYVYTNGTDEVIRRGKKIHAIGYVELVEYDELLGSVTFRVKDDSYATYYKVYIQKFADPRALSVRCSCPYNLGRYRHEAASLIQLQEMLDKNLLQAEEVEYDQRHTVIKMKTIDLKTIRLLSGPETFTAAETYLRTGKANIESAADEVVKATVEIEGRNYPVVIRKNEERNFDTSCDYVDTKHPLCLPKVVVFLQLMNAYGPNYFDSIRNWDKEKNKLLEAYGYSLNDDLKGKFEFAYKEGKPFLRVLDSSIKRINPLQSPKPKPVEAVVVAEEPEPEPGFRLNGAAQRVGVVLNLHHRSYPGFQFEAIQGEPDEEQKQFVGKVEKTDLSKYVNVELFPESDRALIPALRRIQDSELTKYLNRNSPFSGIWENIIHNESEELPAETKHLVVEYMQPKLKKLLNEVADSPFVFVLPPGKPFKTDNLLPIGIETEVLVPFFKIQQKGKQYEISCWVKINGADVSIVANRLTGNLLFLYNEILYNWRSEEDVNRVETFMPKGTQVITKSTWPMQLRNLVLPLAKHY